MKSVKTNSCVDSPNKPNSSSVKSRHLSARTSETVFHIEIHHTSSTGAFFFSNSFSYFSYSVLNIRRNVSLDLTSSMPQGHLVELSSCVLIHIVCLNAKSQIVLNKYSTPLGLSGMSFCKNLSNSPFHIIGYASSPSLEESSSNSSLLNLDR